jgi:hypothetical protein
VVFSHLRRRWYKERGSILMEVQLVPRKGNAGKSSTPEPEVGRTQKAFGEHTNIPQE